MKIEKFMPLTFGYDQSVWDKAKSESREEMVQTAKRRRTITYGQLAQKVRAINFNPMDNAFHKMLGQICVEEYEAGRRLLSVVVVRADDGRPGPGFFDLARQLNQQVVEEDGFFSEELTRVHDAWAT